MKLFAYIIFAALLGILGCKKKHLENDSNIEFALNQSKTINDATFTVSNITDNRCPINADCITAGKAEAYLTVKLKGETKDLTLCIGGDCNRSGVSDQQTFTIASTNYKIKLLEVSPYNNFEKAVVKKTVKLQIVKM
ncbi:hypothetical protein [Pedobacter agri]|uniref:hypothetical protein n=1 Tax=Pedobacter agri TaxID=454586 RepID=UPI00292EEADE|nr:hypothetical protein [Pedobacter agri]